MSRQRIIALLGRPDEPTDAVEEYCRYLREALISEDFKLTIKRIAWNENGWTRATRSLRRHAKGWHGTWVLVQYTALAWSKRGFPLRFLRVLKTLKAAGARVGVVFHDVEPYGGTRVIDALRRRAQLRVMREALSLSDVAVFTVPAEKLSWLKRPPVNALFIPVGANLTITNGTNQRKEMSASEIPSIARSEI